jgi:hypothetical protein
VCVCSHRQDFRAGFNNKISAQIKGVSLDFKNGFLAGINNNKKGLQIEYRHVVLPSLI